MNTFSKHRFKRRPTLVQDNDTYFSAHRLTLVFWTPIDTCSAQGKRIWFQDTDRTLFRTSLVPFSTHVFVLNMRARERWTWSCICVENEKVLVPRMSMCWCVENVNVFVLQTSGHWHWKGERVSVEMTMNWCWTWTCIWVGNESVCVLKMSVFDGWPAIWCAKGQSAGQSGMQKTVNHASKWKQTRKMRKCEKCAKCENANNAAFVSSAHLSYLSHLLHVSHFSHFRIFRIFAFFACFVNTDRHFFRTPIDNLSEPR